jgi:hypothetical protein
MNIFDHLYDYLNADPLLVGTQVSPPNGAFSGTLTGGLWDRPLKRTKPSEPTAGSTPAAFGGESEGGRIRYAAVMVDRGDLRHFQEDAIPTAFTMAIQIHFYAPAHATGKQKILDAEKRIHQLLRDYRFLTDDGVYARVFYRSRYGIVDSEEFRGAVTDYCRYEIVSRREQT